MKFRLAIHIVLAMLPLTPLSGCIKEPYQRFENGIIKVTIDRSETPHSGNISLFFYDTQGALVKQMETKTNNCDVELPLGEYQIIAHNTDASQVEFRGTERYETAEVFACKDPNEEESSIHHTLEPQNIYGAGTHQDGEKITTACSEVQNITVPLAPLTKLLIINFTINNIEARSVSGKLTGVAEGLFLSTKTRNSTFCSTAFTCTPKQGSSTDHGARFNIFGLQTDTKSAGINLIELTIIDHAGTVHKTSSDVTAFLQNIVAQNDGTMPPEVSIELQLSPDPVTQQVTVTILNWNPGGTGDQNITDNSNE